MQYNKISYSAPVSSYLNPFSVRRVLQDLLGIPPLINIPRREISVHECCRGPRFQTLGTQGKIVDGVSL